MRHAVVGFSALLILSSLALADLPNRPHSAVQEAITPHGGGGARGFCSVVYYNLCSGWLWTWSGWSHGEQVGVVFDLPTNCGFMPFEQTSNTHFWWYWRYTMPGRGFTVSYELYEVDGNNCLASSPVGAIAGYDPVERWNYHYGLGTVSTARAAITASWDSGVLPRVATDNNYKNYSAPNACPGYEVRPPHFFYFGGPTTSYCPPQYFALLWGPVQCLMDAGWDDGFSTEAASWSSVKKLFR